MQFQSLDSLCCLSLEILSLDRNHTVLSSGNNPYAVDVKQAHLPLIWEQGVFLFTYKPVSIIRQTFFFSLNFEVKS